MALAYLEIEIILNPIDPWREVMVAQMGVLGFESFMDTSDGFLAYIPQNDFRENNFKQIDIFNTDGLEIKWKSKTIAPQNWNKQWEQNFSPIRIGDSCLVRADFHPSENIKYELVINPKMSFGTGHHETTQLMISILLVMNFEQKLVLDMGTGTGILAILAEKKGAKSVMAVDKDLWCVENTRENIGLNDCQNIIALLSDSVPQIRHYNFVFANIKRNVLLDQIEDYAQVLSPFGDLLISGFYFEDLEMIRSKCESLGFRFICNFEKNNWVAAHFTMK